MSPFVIVPAIAVSPLVLALGYYKLQLALAEMSSAELDVQLQEIKATNCNSKLSPSKWPECLLSPRMVGVYMSDVLDMADFKNNRIIEIQGIIHTWQLAGQMPKLPPGKDPIQYLNDLMRELAKLMGGKWPPEGGPPEGPTLGPAPAA